MAGSAHDEDETSRRVPIVDERLRVATKTIETGRVRIATTVETDEVAIDERLTAVTYRAEPVPVDRIVDTAPPVRTEAGRTIIPVTEEVLVKRIRVVEEIHLIEERSERQVSDMVALRRTAVTVTRDARHDEPADAEEASEQTHQNK